jgi:putative ABC transport system substrate-binding protein
MFFDDFREALRDHGYVEGENLIIETRWPGGRAERNAELARELVALQPDLLVGTNTPPVLALQREAGPIPIVFVGVSDPVGTGMVASLDRPGGTLTGTSDLLVELNRKRLELLLETVPTAVRVAVLWNPHNPATVLDDLTREYAVERGIELVLVAVESPDGLARAAEAIADGVDAAMTMPDTIFGVTNTPEAGPFSANARVPIMHHNRENVLAGGLMGYALNRSALYRRAAYYVDRILKGARPADLPVEGPSEFDLVINRRTAEALGITIPPRALLEATEVVE